MKIGMAGAGGIGSNVARILAQAKVKSVKIVDFDQVETGNLNRQFYRTDQEGLSKVACLKTNLLDIYPEMEIEIVDQKIASGDSKALFEDCAIVVEGFDRKSLKKMIVEELAPTGKPMVSASGIAGRTMETVTTRKIGNCHIVGDFTSDQDEHELYPPKIAMVASLMAARVLELIKTMETRTHDNTE